MCFMLLNPFNKCIGVATPKNTIFHPKMAKSNPIFFTPNQCFLAPGGHFMPPLPYFENAALTKRCVACHGTHLTIVSGPQPPKIHQKAMCFMLLNPFNKCIGVATAKNTIFRPKMAKKCIFLTPNQCFLGPGGHFVPLLPYFQDAALTKRCVALHGTHLATVSGPPSPKKGHFSFKNGQRMAALGRNQCFLGPGGQFVPPLSYFELAELKKIICCRSLNPFNN